MRTWPAIVATLALAGSCIGTADAAPVAGRCVINEAVYRADSPASELVGDTATFSDMPGVSVNFVQGGTAPGCVIVTFSAESFAGTGVNMEIRPILDTSTRSVPAEVQFAANDPDLYTTRTGTFVFRSVAPGPHTIRMQFRSRNTDRTEISAHVLVVQYRR